MERPRPSVCAATLFAAFALYAASASAQSVSAQAQLAVGSPWGTAPAPPPFGASLAPTATPPPPTVAYAPAPPLAPARPARCSADNFGTRLAAEIGVGFAVDAAVVAAVLSAAFARGDDLDTFSMVLLVGGVLVVSPMSVYLVGQGIGGRGNPWSAFLGNLLFGSIGAAIAYEVSTAPACPAGVEGPIGVGPHPRRGPRVASSTGVRLAPWILPMPERGGASIGVGARF